jgi:hypothetical protein
MSFIKTQWIDDMTLVTAGEMNRIEDEVVRLGIDKSDLNHTHDERYSLIGHAHPEYAEIYNVYTKGDIDIMYAGFIGALGANTANIELIDDLLDQLLGGYTGTTVIKDDLVSEYAGAALSANMGKVLNETKLGVDELEAALLPKADVIYVNEELALKVSFIELEQALLDKVDTITLTENYLTSADTESLIEEFLEDYLTSSSISNDYLSKAGNLSGLTNLVTARSNLGLGPMALGTVYIQSGTPSNPKAGDIWVTP